MNSLPGGSIMASFASMKIDELNVLENSLNDRLDKFKRMNLNLNMSRGVPCTEQLDIASDMLNLINKDSSFKAEDGVDCRSYGDLAGIPEAVRLFAGMFEVGLNEIIIGGNSSLNLMYDTMLRAMYFEVVGSEKPWSKNEKVKFICPVPGYDRHFSICEGLGIEMITVGMTPDGPDVDEIEKLVADDDSIKGIWCVPKYSNPEGIIYSDETVTRLAAMKTMASDFRIFWDNAYAFHSLSDESKQLKNILSECKKAGNPNRVFIFGSTSKITFAGAGVSILASSEENIKLIKKQISIQTISFDKINQLRHVKYLKNIENVKDIMKKHAAIIKPKFDAVCDIFEKELSGKEIASWIKPNGGYFMSFNALDGCAKKIVAMAKEAGISMTPAGATYPYGNDPHDRNIRIAPTYPPLDELKTAIEVFCICVQIVSIWKHKKDNGGIKC
jgi:aspartate/methionine/tyrosine aminotransferase